MKIIITVSQITPGGGLSKYICTLADILTKNTNNQIYVITTHDSEDNLQFEQLMAKRTIEYKSLGGLSTIKKYCSLVSLIRKISPDVIINNYNAPTQYILPFLPRRIKVVHILHNNTDDFYRVAAINAKFVHKWVAPTPALQKYFDAYTRYKYSNKISTIPHAVDDALNISPTLSDTAQLTYVGVLYEHKGVLVLPDIIKRIVDKGYKFHFTFIGDGVLRSALEESLSEEIDKGIVDFAGRIPGEEVYTKLQQSDIFVYPTHIDAFGLVIAEAMMNGAVPVVTCLKGITDTIVDDGVNGFLVGQDDVLCFVDRISYLLENKEQRMNMSHAARDKARTNFSKDVMRKNYLEMICAL